MTGWICPVCGRGLSWMVEVCPCYVGKIFIGTGTTTPWPQEPTTGTPMPPRHIIWC